MRRARLSGVVDLVSWPQAGAVLTLATLFALVTWAAWWSERSTYNPGNDDEAFQEPPLFRHRRPADHDDLLDDGQHWRDR